MSTISIATLVNYTQEIVCSGADSGVLTRFATELLEDELPKMPDGYSADIPIASFTSGDPIKSYSGTPRRILALFFGGRELSRETATSLAAHDPRWQDRVGYPLAWTTDYEEDTTVRIYPIPPLMSADGGSTTNETRRNLILAMVAQTTLPLILRLPAALWLLSREYGRESNHRDLAFSKLCAALSDQLFRMADGIAPTPKVKST